jgi:HlyD family secretion protein
MKTIKSFFKLIWAHKGKIILVFLLAGGGWYFYAHKMKKKPLDNEEMTERVRRGDIMISISKDGAFQAKESFEVNSRANGKISQKFVKEGDAVKEGQKLFVVQPGQSVHEKYLPIDVLAPASGLVVRCLNDRWSSRSNTNYDLPQVGESVSGSSGYNNTPTCLMKIIKPGSYVVPIKIGEYDIPNIKLKMPLKISVPSRPGVSYEGFVARISPQPEVKEENYWDQEKNQVEFITIAETKNAVNEILIGLSATVKIDLDSKEDILLIPISAIFEERERNGDITFYVYKKEGNKKAEKIQVKLGLRNESDAELLNAEETGLREKDILLLEMPQDGNDPDKKSLPKFNSGRAARRR